MRDREDVIRMGHGCEEEFECWPPWNKSGARAFRGREKANSGMGAMLSRDGEDAMTTGKRLKLGVTILVSCLLTLLLMHGGAQAQVTLRFCHNQPPDSLRQEAINVMSKRLGELTQGKVTIRSFPGGSLCGSLTALEFQKTGANDLSAEDPGIISNVDPLKRVNILQLPYLATSYRQGWEFMDSDIVKGLYAHLPESAGLRLVSVWDNGVRHFLNSKRAIRTPKDLQGLTIRVVKDPVMTDMVKTFGSSAVPMAWEELFTALQHGVVDGMEGSILNIYFGKMYEVQKHLSFSAHNFGVIPLLISESAWKKLPSDQQVAVVKAGDEAKLYIRKQITDSEDRYLKDMKAKGLQVNEVDKAAFREAATGVYKHFEPQFGKETLKKVLDYAEAIRAKYPD